MLETISPYQLLQASRPKSQPRSIPPAQSTPSAAVSAPHPSACGAPSVPEQPQKAPAFEPSRRTHYIAGIYSRHIAAQRYLPS